MEREVQGLIVSMQPTLQARAVYVGGDLPFLVIREWADLQAREWGRERHAECAAPRVQVWQGD